MDHFDYRDGILHAEDALESDELQDVGEAVLPQNADDLTVAGDVSRELDRALDLVNKHTPQIDWERPLAKRIKRILRRETGCSPARETARGGRPGEGGWSE